ncbi:MAG: competence protein CoiA [Methanoregula sp.]
MEFALSDDKKRIKATKHTKGFCGICGELLIPKCGAVYKPHWAHKAGKDCDPWWESETDWHRSWKNLVSEDFREVTIEKEGIKHRADIQLLSGIVVELQHSPLSYDERCERESFYENMIWIIHLPKAKIELLDHCFEKGLFDDYYAKIENIYEWIYRQPHSSPIILDFDDDNRIFHITEFCGYSTKKRTRYLYGNYLDKKKFIMLLKPIFFDFDLTPFKLSKKHHDFCITQQEKIEREKQIREEQMRNKLEVWKKKKEEEWRMEEEEKRRLFLERNDPKKCEERRIIHDNEKWGLL